jgi:uncharacterized protein (DUF433 family)
MGAPTDDTMREHPYVSETPGVCGGYPVLRGTRIPVWVVLKAYRHFGNLDEILAMYPYLTRERIQGALDYYAAYPDRVDEDIERNERALQELQRRQWPG